MRGLTPETKSYHPSPVKRVYIPKADGSNRTLGIPTLKDRVAQMAVVLILEPIFEADFLDCSHGFRRGRKPHLLNKDHFTAIAACHQVVAGARINKT